MDPLVSWKTPSWPNPASIQPPPSSRRFSTRSDRERDASDYARALSSDVDPYASSIISSSDSNSHYRSSRGSRGSAASSLLCPLLDLHDSSRRQSDAGFSMPMRPLPAINPSTDPSALYSASHLDSAYRAQLLNKQCNNSTSTGTPSPASSSMSNSNSTLGGNLFIPLRRRFLPNLDRSSQCAKPRVETQLLGELLLALEEYVAAFGRQVKVSPSHQFSLGGGSAAVVVVAAAAGSSNDPTITHLASCNLMKTCPNRTPPSLPRQSTDQDSTLINLDCPETELWGLSMSDPPTEELDQRMRTVPLTSQSQCQVERALLSELCEELEYVTSEVIDVVPALGEKLMQGHYGPLAVRANQTYSSTSRAKFSSALERFSDYEPGGSQDTSDGGSGWWAERLLRDLLEGIVAETVVKSGSTTTLLMANPNLCSAIDHCESSRLPKDNRHDQFRPQKTDRKLATQQAPVGKSKNWLRMPQTSTINGSRATSVISPAKYSCHYGTLGFSHIDEGEESHIAATSEAAAKSDLTRELLAEASQDSIFENRQRSSHSFESGRICSDSEGNKQNKKIVFYGEEGRSRKPVDFLGEKGAEESQEKKLMDEERRQKLLDEGRRRWQAYKAAQPPHSTSTTTITTTTSRRHQPVPRPTTSSSALPLAAPLNPLIHCHSQPARGRSSSGSAIVKPQPRHLYNYLASHKS